MCSPSGRDCIDNESKDESFNCRAPCVGMYADVSVSGKHALLEDFDEVPKQLKQLVEAYRRHKRRLVKNILFNSSAHLMGFGEHISNQFVSNVLFQPKRCQSRPCNLSRYTLTQPLLTRHMIFKH